MQPATLEVVNRPPADLRPNPRNPRKHSKKQIRQIADSMQEFGFTNPILLDDADWIIAGHGRVAAAKLLGIATVPTIRLGQELTEQRRQLAGQRHAFEHELERQRDLRRQRARAQEVLLDLTAFCERVRGRLDEASFTDKQAVLQLVVERVIVHESSLEIRHVIPLHSPPPGREGPAQADGRLRSDRVDDVAGPGGTRAGAEARLRVVRGLDRLCRRRRIVLAP